ncbi:hypothetical protein M9M90_21000 (plasmid) [Phenylobacterium sp. LH3H17]|uniref:hypothetical protein n=1 Tax=Phenylobacterium sp. LH3H17 TaxID=2903901 RepID=UPI0020C9836C|nr:hypothetical protein [Phenylobacterium sp. LH3H17]UTP41706.1 hypothetical protein M9M90_21000 [Phenylobacterium sp. LH3H17]
MGDPLQRKHRFGQTMHDMLSQAGVTHDSVIRIAGPGGLAPLLWFCRHGYNKVGYVRQGPCPADDCDLLLVLNASSPETLARTLHDASHVKAGGILVIETPTPAAGMKVDPVHRALETCGYHVERCLHGAHKEIHVARREVAPMKKAA